MAPTFDSNEFIKELAQDLVSNFNKASKATTPSLKGAAKENEVRRKLERLLPSGVGIGTGCVIDCEGNASKQQDVILFEKDLCPVFSINETSETTYYPCEGVIAVGEIKAVIGKQEVEDSFSKIESVKKLKRFAVKSKSLLVAEETVRFRKYLSVQAMSGTIEEEFNQDKKTSDQIYGFILCGDFSVTMDTLYKHISTQQKAIDATLLPNIMVSLRGEIFSPYNQKTSKGCSSVMDGTGYVHGVSDGGSFKYLLIKLLRIIRHGRTVEANIFERYYIKEPSKLGLNIKRIIDVE